MSGSTSSPKVPSIFPLKRVEPIYRAGCPTRTRSSTPAPRDLGEFQGGQLPLMGGHLGHDDGRGCCGSQHLYGLRRCWPRLAVRGLKRPTGLAGAGVRGPRPGLVGAAGVTRPCIASGLLVCFLVGSGDHLVSHTTTGSKKSVLKRIAKEGSKIGASCFCLVHRQERLKGRTRRVTCLRS